MASLTPSKDDDVMADRAEKLGALYHEIQSQDYACCEVVCAFPHGGNCHCFNTALAQFVAAEIDRLKVVNEALVSAREWRDISTAPRDGTAVLVYFARLEYRDMDGNVVSLGPLRDHVERTAIGYYLDGIWHESGTAHDMFETWRNETQLPTHWQPLPEPPALALASAGL